MQTEPKAALQSLAEQVQQQLLYYPTVTREPFRNQGRLNDLVEGGKLASDLSLPAVYAEHDRFMLCGSPEMLADMTAWLRAEGFHEGSHTTPAEFVVEKAFVEK